MKNFFYNLIVISLILLLVFVIYLKYIIKSQIISVFGYKFMIVLTGSMEPEIKAGSFIVIKDMPSYKIRGCYYIY